MIVATCQRGARLGAGKPCSGHSVRQARRALAGSSVDGPRARVDTMRTAALPGPRERRWVHQSASAGGKGMLGTLLQTAKSNRVITSQWYGQATHETHPELVGAGEVTPGITQQEYEMRRRGLVEELGDGGVAVVFSAPMQFVSPHVFRAYRQDSDFFYLTGWNEPEAVAVIEKNKHAARGYTMVMYVSPKDPERELWEGPRNGLEAAVGLFGADEAFPIGSFGSCTERIVRELKRSEPRGAVYVDIDDAHGVARSAHCRRFAQACRSAGVGARIHALTRKVQGLRLIKSRAEIGLMREACRLSGHGFRAMMQQCQPGVSEASLQGIFDRAAQDACRDAATKTDRAALTRPAYVPVVAAGEHALCLHYVQNAGPVHDGDLVLVDAGAEYAAYASDISRTFPAGGRFTEPQRDLYSAVLEVQRQTIRLCHAASGHSLNYIHRESSRILAEELKQIGFSASSRDIDTLYPHHISHYLGLDVHDTIDMTRSQALKQNMAVTIEPGVYVPHDSAFPKAFHGIGIRIEDNIIVGSSAEESENLSRSIPKEIDEIESIMSM